MIPFKNPKSDLRSKYNKIMGHSFIISLAIFILAFQYFPKIEVKKIEPPKPEDPIYVTEIATKIDNPLPPPPRPPQVVEELNPDLEELEFEQTVLIMDEPVQSPPPRPETERVYEDEVVDFYLIESKPEIVGGLSSLYDNLIYPELDKRVGNKGLVIVQIVVNKNGDVSDAKIIKSVSEGLDSATIEAVKKLKFIPGKQRGKAVSVRMNIPVHYKLN